MRRTGNLGTRAGGNTKEPNRLIAGLLFIMDLGFHTAVEIAHQVELAFTRA